MARTVCEGCHRPKNVCLCPHLVSLTAPVEVVILQHPTERKQALATVPLLELCLTPLSVYVGEDFTQASFVKDLLDRPKSCRVLFPAEGAEFWTIDAPRALKEPFETLIVIDGTWRKAKRIWLSNPWLHELPAVMLDGLPASEYRIRSSSVEGGVSTLEAVTAALNYVAEMEEVDPFEPLLKPFRVMVDQQIKKMGPEVFKAHYEKI